MHYKRKNGGCQGIIMHKETKTDSAGAKIEQPYAVRIRLLRV